MLGSSKIAMLTLQNVNDFRVNIELCLYVLISKNGLRVFGGTVPTKYILITCTPSRSTLKPHGGTYSGTDWSYLRITTQIPPKWYHEEFPVQNFSRPSSTFTASTRMVPRSTTNRLFLRSGSVCFRCCSFAT